MFSPHHLPGQPDAAPAGSTSYEPTIYGAAGAATTSYVPGGVPAETPGYPSGGYPSGGHLAGGYPFAGYGGYGPPPYDAPPAPASYAAPPGSPPRRNSTAITLGIAVPLLALVAVLAWVLLKPGGTSSADQGKATTSVSTSATSSPVPSTTAAPNPAPETITAYADVVVSAGSVECAREGAGPFAAAAVRDSRTTTCPFALDVRRAYAAAGYNGGAGAVTAYSPVTGETYAMSCTPSDSVIVCTGGRNALVMIYGGKLVIGG